MSHSTDTIASGATAVSSAAAERLKRICVHVSPKHLADAKRLSQALSATGGKRLTAAAVLRLAQDKGLELLLQEQEFLGR